MDLKLFLILALATVFCEGRSARMTKEWPPPGNQQKRDINPHNRMAMKDTFEYNRMGKNLKRSEINPHNRMALKDVSSYNKMGKRAVECADSPPDSHVDISAEVSAQ